MTDCTTEYCDISSLLKMCFRIAFNGRDKYLKCNTYKCNHNSIIEENIKIVFCVVVLQSKSRFSYIIDKLYVTLWLSLASENQAYKGKNTFIYEN